MSRSHGSKNRWIWPKLGFAGQQLQCTKLETAKERCPIVFQGHPSNFKVTRDKTSPILTQIGRFWTIGRSQLSNPSDFFIQRLLLPQHGDILICLKIPYLCMLLLFYLHTFYCDTPTVIGAKVCIIYSKWRLINGTSASNYAHSFF